MKSIRFLDCRIDLSKWNFTPRPETGFWVKKAVKEIKSAEDRPPRILDMFSGSGCIGIAILKNIKNSRADFSDVGKKAVEQIKINLKLNRIPQGRYKIYKPDLFKNLPKKSYDYIFANPPYVAKDKLKEVQPSVLQCEPKTALFGGKKGLFYIKKFLKQAKSFLAGTGGIFLEFSPEQKKDIEKILIREGYKEYYFLKDQFK